MKTSKEDTNVSFIKNAILPCEEGGKQVVIGIEDGRIKSITSRLPQEDANAARVIDAKGTTIIPGLVDINVGLKSGSLESGPEFARLTDVTAKSGITTIAPQLGDKALGNAPAGIRRIRDLSQHNDKLSIAPIAALTRDDQTTQLSDMGILKQAGAVAFCDGPMPIQSARFLRAALQYSASIGGLIIQNPQDISFNEDACATDGRIASWLGLPSIPSCVEDIMVGRDIRLAEVTGGRLHFSNITTRRSIELIRWAKERGIAITCDSSAPYFLLNEEAIDHYHVGAHLFPPLRCEDDRRAVCEGLRDGTIDAITSHHTPVTIEGKKRPFAQSQPGFWGLHTFLGTTLKLVKDNTLPLAQAVALLTQKPAHVLGLGSNALNVGDWADFCLIDLARSWSLKEELSVEKIRVTPFYDTTLEGKILQTWKKGTCIYRS